MTNQTKRSIEEIVQEYDGLAFTISEAKDWLRKTLQTERQKRYEVVEERDKQWRDHLKVILGTEIYGLHEKYFTKEYWEKAKALTQTNNPK